MPDDPNTTEESPTPDFVPPMDSEPMQTPEPSATTPAGEVKADRQTAQMAGNEPLPVSTESSGEAKAKPEVETLEPKSETSMPTETLPPLAVKTLHDTTHENLAKAQLTIQNKKRKKLDLILTLFAKRKNITNDEVEKLLHVSDATATRYLSILEKEEKIKQNGKTGHMVSYSRI